MSDERPRKAFVPIHVQDLANTVFALKQEIKELKDQLNLHENWHTEVRNMIGKQVEISVIEEGIMLGKLLWTDRYNLCIEMQGQRRIVTKGGLLYIQLTRKA